MFDHRVVQCGMPRVAIVSINVTIHQHGNGSHGNPTHNVM